MSADNWATCPRCYDRACKAADAELWAVMATYGKVPVEAFDRARSKLAVPSEREFHTFREDYEISGADTGIVTVHYSGHCGTCGLNLKFKDEHPIDGAP